MTRLPRTARTLALLALALSLSPPAASAQQAPDLHVIIVADTDDPIGPGCFKDLMTVRGLFAPKDAKDAPGGKVEVKVFAGKQTFPQDDPQYKAPDNFNQKAIKDYLASIPLGRHTGVLVYFSGHGDYTTADGHRMVIPGPNGDRMPNEDVIRAVAARNTAVRMVAVITDSCCPNVGDDIRRKGPRTVPGPRSRSGARVKNVLNDLFLRPGSGEPAAALLDINGAAENQLAFGPPETGGFFTVGLDRAIKANAADSGYVDDANGDGVLTWHEIMPRVIRLTKEEFDACKKANGAAALVGADGKPQPTQFPQAFRLPTPGQNHRYRYTVGVEGKGVAGGGMQVVKVTPGGPAAAAGLQPGDVIRKANGRSVRNFNDFAGTVDFAEDPRLELLVDRGGKLETVAVTMKEN